MEYSVPRLTFQAMYDPLFFAFELHKASQVDLLRQAAERRLAKAALARTRRWWAHLAAVLLGMGSAAQLPSQ